MCVCVKPIIINVSGVFPPINPSYFDVNKRAIRFSPKAIYQRYSQSRKFYIDMLYLTLVLPCTCNIHLPRLCSRDCCPCRAAPDARGSWEKTVGASGYGKLWQTINHPSLIRRLDAMVAGRHPSFMFVQLDGKLAHICTIPQSSP